MTTLSPSAPPTEAREREFFVSKTSLFDQKNEVLNAKIGVRNILGNRLHFPHPSHNSQVQKKKSNKIISEHWSLVSAQK